MNHSDQTKQITAQTEKMLIDQYERLYRLAYSYVHNEADALDIVQESACKAITQCKKFKGYRKTFSMAVPDRSKYKPGPAAKPDKRAACRGTS